MKVRIEGCTQEQMRVDYLTVGKEYETVRFGAEDHMILNDNGDESYCLREPYHCAHLPKGAVWVVTKECCTPTADELKLLAEGSYTPEELWGGSRPTCPKCFGK